LFDRSAQCGAPDQLTRDLVPVLWHDFTINDGVNTFCVYDLTLAEFKVGAAALDGGARSADAQTGGDATTFGQLDQAQLSQPALQL
jgi:glycerophosphoryl diester phosphodiesterase